MKKVLVTLANKDYTNHAKSLFTNVREEGEWDGDLVLMVPEEDKEFVDVDLFNYNDVQIFFLPNLEKGKYPLDLNTTLDVKFHPINCYKIHLFGNDYFKQWDWIFYTDLDVWYFNKIDFDLDNKRKDILYANTCNDKQLQLQFVWLKDMIEQLNISDKKKLKELKDYPGYYEPAIQGCFLLLNKQFIRNDIFKKYKEVHDKYYKLAVWSQGLWSLLFYGKWDILGDKFKTIYEIGYNKTVEKYNRIDDAIKDNIDYKNDGVIAQHFSQYFPQYSPSNLRFYPLYLNNRVKFESVLEKLSSKEYFDLEMKDKLYNLFESNNFNIDILKSNKSYMRGGAILRLFMGIPLTDADLDLYFLDSKYFKRVDDYFNEHYEFLHETPNTKSYKCGELEFELVRHPYLIGTYEYTTSMTDFTITLGCFDFETELFVYPDTYLADIESKKLRIHRLEIEPPEGRSWANALERIEKYGKLGFTASDDVVETIKKNSELKDNDEFHQRTVKKSWLRNTDLTPIVPNIDVFVNWLMDIKKHKYFNKFNYYLTGGFMAWPDKTKDVDIIITKRNGRRATLRELEELMVDMFDSAYDIHGFFLDTFYMRTPQWIADYPRDREILKSVENKGLWITITKHRPEYSNKFRRYGKLNCHHRPSFTNWWDDGEDLINRWVNLDAKYAKWVDLRKIIKYYDNNKERNIDDFLNKFQEYSGY